MSTQRSSRWHVPICTSAFVAILSLGLTGCPVDEVEPGPNIYPLTGPFQGQGTFGSPGDSDLWTLEFAPGLAGHYSFSFDLPPGSNATINIGVENWYLCSGTARCTFTGYPRQGFDVPLEVWPGLYASSVTVQFWGALAGTSSTKQTYSFKVEGPALPSTTTTTSGGGGSSTLPPAVCGDHVRAGAEQCDDGNTVAGDLCSPTCRWERPAGCQPQDGTTSYLQQYATDPNFNITLARARDRGYDSDLLDTWRCTGPSGTGYIARLLHSDGLHFAYIRSRADVSDFATTMFYEFTPEGYEMVHARGSLRVYMDPNGNITSWVLVDVHDNVIGGSAGGAAASLLSDCSQYLLDWNLCLFQKGLQKGASWTQCGLEIGVTGGLCMSAVGLTAFPPTSLLGGTLVGGCTLGGIALFEWGDAAVGSLGECGEAWNFDELAGTCDEADVVGLPCDDGPQCIGGVQKTCQIVKGVSARQLDCVCPLHITDVVPDPTNSNVNLDGFITNDEIADITIYYAGQPQFPVRVQVVARTDLAYCTTKPGWTLMKPIEKVYNSGNGSFAFFNVIDASNDESALACSLDAAQFPAEVMFTDAHGRQTNVAPFTWRCGANCPIL